MNKLMKNKNDQKFGNMIFKSLFSSPKLHLFDKNNIVKTVIL